MQKYFLFRKKCTPMPRMTIIENGHIRYYQRKQAGTKEILSSFPNTEKMKFGDGSLMGDNSSF